MKKIKLPSPIVMIFASIGAFWLANMVNPGFNPVGIMILLLIPVLIVEFLYPQPALEQLVKQSLAASVEKPEAEEVTPKNHVNTEPPTETA